MGKPKKYKMKEMINKELEDPKLRELYSIRWIIIYYILIFLKKKL